MPNPHPAIGRIVAPHHVAAAVQTQLQTWIETYLAALSVQDHGQAHAYQPIATWGSVPALDGQVGRQHPAPAILVAPDGMTATAGGVEDVLDATVAIGVLIYTVAARVEDALQLSSVYGAAVASVFTQHPWLPGIDGALVTVERQALHEHVNDQHQTEGWGLIDLTVRIPGACQGGNTTGPALNRDLDAITPATITSVACDWVTP